MHYGYFRKGMNPFHREPVLNQMTQEVFNRLELDPDKGPAILDMGCGVGASIRYLVKKYNNLSLQGITIVPWQIEKGDTKGYKEFCRKRWASAPDIHTGLGISYIRSITGFRASTGTIA
ncbi:MAG: class I SAM-dependent methyltransferase [Cytophagales bacterium]|nr:class I SAM-dependent methyltransferase [Cytophagales bacterium]